MAREATDPQDLVRRAPAAHATLPKGKAETPLFLHGPNFAMQFVFFVAFW